MKNARKDVRKAKRRIAVVDDEKDFLLLIEGWLGPDYEVAVFSNPVGAAELIRDFRPDAVVLDVHMPEESGFKVCRDLRAIPGFEGLPVVFLTGSKTDEDFMLHVETGGSRYLTKPIARATLLKALAEQLGGQLVA